LSYIDGDYGSSLMLDGTLRFWFIANKTPRLRELHPKSWTLTGGV
jgi:hypothetical protein